MRPSRRHLLAAALASTCAAGLAACSGSSSTPPTTRADLGAVQRFEIPAGWRHVETPVSYPQSPPVGGDHNGAWQNCGAYAEPVPNEFAVHSLEHGAVWITHGPDLTVAEVTALRSRTAGLSHLLISPYEGLRSPIVLSAWGAQLAVDSASDPRIDAFISEFHRSAASPEPNAACSNAIGVPL